MTALPTRSPIGTDIAMRPDTGSQTIPRQDRYRDLDLCDGSQNSQQPGVARKSAVIRKARRLLGSGDVHIKWTTDSLIAATVRGDTGIYDVRWQRLTGWHCTCPSYGECSHREAVRIVTMRSVPAVTS